MKAILLGLLGAASLTGSLAARSAPITYQFAVTGGISGPLAGQTATGSFTYDSSIIPTGGGVVNKLGLFSALSFTWDGNSYNQTTANTAQLWFDSSGVLIGTLFGTHCIPGGCGISPGTSEWWFQWYPDLRDFTYALTTVGGTYGGTAEIPALQPPPPPAVREPGTVALFGLAALILIRRRAMALRK
jgi:MYXO-CTERM domain-containing protein